MSQPVDPRRRRLLSAAAVAAVAAPLGILGLLARSGRLAFGAPSASDELASLAGADGWINSAPLTAQGLQGKVVVVQFWTYTCINWLRTLPYVRAWSARYAPKGLVTIGVHAPEFPFEHDGDNVSLMARRLDVAYPVAIDNDFSIWRAFGNRFWPALYLIDAQGRIRFQHFGEGEYEKTERAIRDALGDAGARDLGSDLTPVTGKGVEAAADWRTLRTPETYVEAADRANRKQQIRFHARDLHLVMGPAKRGASVPFRVTLDGKPPGDAHGLDVDAQGIGVAREQRMYQLIRQPGRIGDRAFAIEFLDAGAESWAFTFG